MTQCLVLIGVLGATLQATASAGAKSETFARFEYELGSAIAGATSGHCTTYGTIFPTGHADAFEWESQGGTLTEFLTEWNTTRIGSPDQNPIQYSSGLEQRLVDDDAIPAGHGRVSWPALGRIRVFGEAWPSSQIRPYEARLQTQDLSIDPLSQLGNTDQYFVKHDGVVWLDYNGLPGWNRLVQFHDGQATLLGNLTLYLEGATVEPPSSDGRTLPPPHEVVVVYENDAAAQYRQRHHHAILRLQDASIPLGPQQASVACKNLEARVEGTLVAHTAKGEVTSGAETRPFGPADLSMDGRFDLHETYRIQDEHSAVIESTAAGDFRAVGLEFKDAGLATGQVPLVVKATVGAALVAILLAVAGWRLYTRLEKPALLDSSTRTVVHEALRANSWTSLPQLQRMTGLPRSTLRYQLGVLRRHGLARMHGSGPGARFALEGEGAAAVPPAEPVLETIHARLEAAPARLADVMRVVCAAHEMSRYGAWKAVRRAAAQKRVELERGPEGVWVRWLA